MKKYGTFLILAIFALQAVLAENEKSPTVTVNQSFAGAGFTLREWDTSLTIGLNISAVPVGQRNMTSLGNQTTFSIPGFDLKLYPKSEAYELEIVLKRKPAKNSLSFPLQTENLNFFYQPPLDDEHHVGERGITKCNETACIDANNTVILYRPENVVGSYAVYHSSKRDNEYLTGKAYHIYRPNLTDAEGLTAWANLSFDPVKGTMTVTVPQSFLDTATYPVTLDPTFGYNHAGASWDVLQLGYSVAGKANETAPATGTFTAMYTYTRYPSVARLVKCGTYTTNSSSKPGAAVYINNTGFTPTSTTGSWKNCPGFTGSVTSGAYYWGGWLQVNNLGSQIAYDSSGTHYYVGSQTNLVDPFPGSASSTNKFSVYWEYSTSTGPVLSCVYGTGISKIQYIINTQSAFPQTPNATNQTAAVPLLNCSNTGDATGHLQIKRSVAYSGVNDFCGITSTPNVNLTTAYQNLTDVAAAGHQELWCLRNYTALPGAKVAENYTLQLIT